MSNAQCFYPNGNPSLEDDIPCGTGSAVGCCPLDWACQANGLCYLQNEDYYGRYTCTDKSWGPGCPDICTYNNTASGNEAVLECTPGSYCCDTNRPELSGGTDCCNASPSRFSIDGNAEIPSTSMSPVQSSSSVPVSAAASSISPQTSTTAAAAAISSPSCDSGLGQISCGSICCATGQYCAYAGQCTTSSSMIESGSGMPTFKSTVTAAATSSSDSIPTATGYTSMISSSQSASLATSSATSTSTPTTSSSVAVITTTTAAVTPTAAPSPSITHSKKFKAGVSVGGAAGLFLLLLALFFWRRHRRKRQYQPAKSGYEDSGNIELTNVAHYNTTEPPVPNPYTQRFPLNRPPNDERGPVESRSRSNFALVPDHDQEHHHPQPNLQHAPALNPYNVPPPAAAAGAAFGDQERWRNMSPVPSYRTEDPAVRAQASLSRGP